MPLTGCAGAISVGPDEERDNRRMGGHVNAAQKQCRLPHDLRMVISLWPFVSRSHEAWDRPVLQRMSATHQPVPPTAIDLLRDGPEKLD